MIDFKDEIRHVFLPYLSDWIGDYCGEVTRFSDAYPHLYYYMKVCQSVKVKGENGITLHCYKDKHKNIICRYYHEVGR